MTIIRKRGDRAKYEVRDRECIGRECLNIHRVASRAPTMSGSRTTGYRDVCARRDYYGCPQPIPEFNRALAAARRKDGMRVA